ncbi:MAG: DUF3416 domain-containing protein [Hyphomicrobiales bacterium]|nr:DUF3416 domain-containing protein [Hyphomicrobiales bacterium]
MKPELLRQEETKGCGALAPGPRIYNLFPSLVGTIAAWRRELSRIASMGFDWVYLNPFHEIGFSGSLYAIKDPSRIDHRFIDSGKEDGQAQLSQFVRDAAQRGVKVMTDLVINHLSKDARLLSEKPEVFRRGSDGRPLSPFAFDPADRATRTEWGDLAELDYGNSAASEYLIGYWDRYINGLQQLGIRGFRCDAAYKVPPAVWGALIASAKARRADCIFFAETLGCTQDETRATAAAGFDFLFNSFAWWDLKEPWALAQYEALRLIAPSIAFPENHDTPRLAAKLDTENPNRVAEALKLRYGLAALFSTGVLMPIGYEWGYRRSLDVVETRPEHREKTFIDISDFITAINRLRADLPASNVEGAQRRIGGPDKPYLALLRIDAGHALAAHHGTLILANPGRGDVAVRADELLCESGGLLDQFVDVTPSRSQTALVPGEELTLHGGELRVYAATRRQRKVRARPLQPSGKRRILIEKVWPEIDGGRTPVKQIVGEVVDVWADIVTDGHEIVAAELLWRAAGETQWRRSPMRFFDNDRWSGSFPLERNICHEFTIEAWRSPFASWREEVRKKAAAGQDLRIETIEGLRLAEHAAAHASGSAAARLTELLALARSQAEGSPAQRALLLAEDNAALIERYAERENLSRYDRVLKVMADRQAARFSAWYELFPRSQSGDAKRHGTLQDVIGRLEYVREMGFDVLYFPPIHPIGRTNRKGRNNSISAEPADLGSVYAIGDESGGHEAIHPALGTREEFRELIAQAQAHGLEIALDFAIQCSPDHPWIRQHPEWFDWRPDGTLKYAENPPKKYEDIVNVHFYGASLPGLWFALRDIVLFWAGEGVRIFRVDNPHTKPLPFWRWLIREVNERYPDVLFLAEAFTRPKMMKALAKAGFQQSYTYFTWRNTKEELVEYITELSSSEMREYYRPNFFVNTPDINPFYLQKSGRAGFIVRSTLAATLASSWGIYSGFELCEATPIPGREEYIDSEKYELKARDFERPGNIRAHIATLNAIRRSNPALHDFRNVSFLNAWNDEIIAYLRMTPRRDNCIMVMVNLDPHHRQECDYEVPLWEFGLPDTAMLQAEDLLQGGNFSLRGKVHRIALDPSDRPVTIWRLLAPQRPEPTP